MMELQSVKKHFREGFIVRALDGVDLSVKLGEYVAITGASGSGKSTLLSILGCLERPTEGIYKVDGLNTVELSDVAISSLRARNFGFVFQSFHLLNELTAQDNVVLPMKYGDIPKKRWRVRARTLLEKVGLEKRLDHYPSQLSGGEQQRVALARALANDPRILLADEPTGNLDSKTRDSILEILEEEWRNGRTLIIVTHDKDVARRATRQIILSDGVIVEDIQQIASNY